MKKKSKKLYDCLDTNNNQTLSIDEFFEVVEVLESHESFAIPLIKASIRGKSRKGEGFGRHSEKKLIINFTFLH